ncbi:choline dehydrogenase [Aspergillus oryzae 3.042]|uniref:Choline dehydrogenase n=1 Tax=Aspergillus oryzae (strain 3.042) TaxID=1160506 RepID=I8ID54_ASPO3|nr:choline dehydrogenase [Aspergillus oryzae 3.042]|eukprot:EIT75731.1 choline dehydrogenase [Aspergillus oryzae 3.042]
MGIKTNEDLEAGYVIVGGGTSGIVLAARLSEDDSKSVIIREAGRNLADDFRVQTPALWTTLLGSEADWQLITAPQTELRNRIIKEPQGKLLGGLHRSLQAEIHAWSKLSATDWTWEKLSPYYKKSYTLQLPDEATREHIGLSWVDQNVNGDSGPINISFPAVLQDPLSKAWVDTFKGIGYSLTADPFSGNSIAGYSNLATVDYKTKTRSYAATGYGLPAMQRPGDAGVTATGVKAILQGELSTIKAKKEVILTAGALNTPKLLELSGIGNKAILDQFNIPVVVENPNVDENIQDFFFCWFCFQEVMQNAMQLYTKHKAGPMTIVEAKQAYLNRFILQPEGRDQVIRDIYAADNEPTCSISVGQELLPGNFLSLGLELSLPFSRGSVHIASADPNVPPTIDPRYFSNPLDLDIMARNLLDFLVYGVTNLRVCDASVFALVPPANIMSTVYAVAERAADIIKSDA